MDRALLSDMMAGVDFVFHLAAMVSVPESVEKPQECVTTNTIGLLNVLEAAATAKVRKLCFSSTAAIYGDNPTVPKHERMTPEPRSPYAITKLDGEYYCDLFHQRGLLNTVSLRYFNVFGPRQNPRGHYAAAVPIFIDHALRNEPIDIYGDGEQTRDFIYVKDIVAANVFAAMESTATGVFNVACGRKMSINELAGEIIRITGSSSEIRYLPVRAGDVKHSQASIERFRAAGFEPTFDFAAGLHSTVEQLRAIVH
jgi:UDP-glucose 4-epimerase